MKIRLVSDLHLEFPQAEIDLQNNDGTDVLILGGDITTAAYFDGQPKKLMEFFQSCADRFPHVLYIMGNHEAYGRDLLETERFLRSNVEVFPNFHFLEGEAVVIDGVPFFGATLWTDLNGGDQYVRKAVGRGMNDYRRITLNRKKLTPEDTIRIHANTLANIKRFLARWKNQKVVICTHHSPCLDSIHPRFKGDPLNFGYSSNLAPMIRDHPNIALWSHGHTHDSFDYNVGETRIVCNPAGYQAALLGLRSRVFENKTFDPNKTVEI